jgi:predicted Ser/Thr protein kinase
VFSSGLGELIISAQIGKGKSAYSYSADLRGRKVVLKLMHDESNPFYEFEGNKVELEEKAYRILTSLPINIPEMLYSSVEKNYIIKEYIEGETAAVRISESAVTEDLIEQLFKMAHLAENSGYNLDYFPTNFLATDRKLFYIDYEVNEYDPNWSLQNWGIYYWANSAGFRDFLISGDATKINSDINNGIPIKEPFKETVDYWQKKFQISRNKS